MNPFDIIDIKNTGPDTIIYLMLLYLMFFMMKHFKGGLESIKINMAKLQNVPKDIANILYLIMSLYNILLANFAKMSGMDAKLSSDGKDQTHFHEMVEDSHKMIKEMQDEMKRRTEN